MFHKIYNYIFLRPNCLKQAGFIESYLHYSNIRMGFFAIMGITICIGYLLLEGPGVTTLVRHGALEISQAELLSENPMDELQSNFVQIRGEESFDIGQEIRERKKSGDTVEAIYSLMLLEDKALLIKRDPNEPEGQTIFQGSLKKIPNSVKRDILLSISKESPGLEEIILPFELDATDHQTVGKVFFLFGAILLIFSSWKLKQFVERYFDITLHPTFKLFEGYGEAREVADSINNELFESSSVQTITSTLLTSNWIVQKRLFGLSVIRLYDLVWIYKETFIRRVYFVPLYWYSEVSIHDSYGDSLEFKGTKKDLEELLTQVLNKAPWVHVGYDAEIEEQMSGSYREGTINGILKYREELLGLSTG